MSPLKGLFSSKKSDEEFEKELFRALFVPNKKRAIELINKYKIDLNKYLDNYSNSILINAVNCSSDFRDSKEQLEIIDHLLEKNADVNYINENGFNALHIALEYHSLSKTSLLLIKKGNAHINEAERKNGNSLIFTAIREYGLTWGEEQREVNQLRFEIIDELLNRGADLDKTNNHGISARKWIERVPESDRLHNLINEFDKK